MLAVGAAQESRGIGDEEEGNVKVGSRGIDDVEALRRASGCWAKRSS